MRGGTEMKVQHIFIDNGLSPLARGNQLERLKMETMKWSIPACAGEPARNRGKR